MSHQAELENYRNAVAYLGTVEGARLPADFAATDATMKAKLKTTLRAFMIDPQTKAILTTDQNYALMAKIVADLEEELDFGFVKPGQDWITALKQRAYVLGLKYEAQLVRGGSIADAVILQGVDATTLRLIQQQTYDQVRLIADGQRDYIRRTLTSAILNNRTWDVTMDKVIVDGKIPALEVIDKNGVARYIEKETRVETLVRTETSRLAELGTKDKAKEIFGEEDLGGKWHTIMDGRERPSHQARNGMVKFIKDWETIPGPDGKIISPGEEPNCRCWMEWGNYEELKGIRPPLRPRDEAQVKPPKPPVKPPEKPVEIPKIPVKQKPPKAEAPKPPKAATAPPAKEPVEGVDYAYKFADLEKYGYKKGYGYKEKTIPDFHDRVKRLFKVMDRYFKKEGIVVGTPSKVSPYEMRTLAAWYRKLPQGVRDRWKAAGGKLYLCPGKTQMGKDPALLARLIETAKTSPALARRELHMPASVQLTEENIRKYAEDAYSGFAGLHWGTWNNKAPQIWIGADYAGATSSAQPAMGTIQHEFGHFIDRMIYDPSLTPQFISLLKKADTETLFDTGEKVIKAAYHLTSSTYGAVAIRRQEVLAEMLCVYLGGPAKNAELLEQWPEMWELCRRLVNVDDEPWMTNDLFKKLTAAAKKYKKTGKPMTVDEVFDVAE